MSSLRLLSLVAGIFGAAALAAGPTYKTVTKQGTVVYSDRPSPGAEIINLPSAQTYDAPPAPPVATSAAKPAAAAVEYQQLDLWKPKNDEVFVNTGHTVSVRLRLEPALQKGHSIYLYLDGKRIDGLPTAGDSFELNEVFRGTHTLNALVADSKGTPLIRSQPVTFHVRQTSVLLRPQQNRPRP